MEISTLQIELFVLVMALVGLAFSAWLLRRFPLQFWYEKRLPWLFPKDMVVAAEKMAQEHPYRHMFLVFIGLLGASYNSICNVHNQPVRAPYQTEAGPDIPDHR